VKSRVIILQQSPTSEQENNNSSRYNFLRPKNLKILRPNFQNIQILWEHSSVNPAQHKARHQVIVEFISIVMGQVSSIPSTLYNYYYSPPLLPEPVRESNVRNGVAGQQVLESLKHRGMLFTHQHKLQ
jgi:hypothetical protein